MTNLVSWIFSLLECPFFPFIFMIITHLSYYCYIHLSTCSYTAYFSLPYWYNFTGLISLYKLYIYIYIKSEIFWVNKCHIFPLFPKPNSSVAHFYNFMFNHLTSWSFEHNFFSFIVPLDNFCIYLHWKFAFLSFI